MKGPGKWLFRCIPMHSHASWAQNNIMRTPSFFTEGDFSRANFGCESFRPVPEFELICFNLLFHFFAQQHFLLLLLFGLSTKLRGGINFFIFFLLSSSIVLIQLSLSLSLSFPPSPFPLSLSPLTPVTRTSFHLYNSLESLVQKRRRPVEKNRYRWSHNSTCFSKRHGLGCFAINQNQWRENGVHCWVGLKSGTVIAMTSASGPFWTL